MFKFIGIKSNSDRDLRQYAVESQDFIQDLIESASPGYDNVTSAQSISTQHLDHIDNKKGLKKKIFNFLIYVKNKGLCTRLLMDVIANTH